MSSSAIFLISECLRHIVCWRNCSRWAPDSESYIKNSKTYRIPTDSTSQSWVNDAGLDINGLCDLSFPPRTLKLFVWCINIGCTWQRAGIHYRWEHTTCRNYLQTQVTLSVSILTPEKLLDQFSSYFHILAMTLSIYEHIILE